MGGRAEEERSRGRHERHERQEEGSGSSGLWACKRRRGHQEAQDICLLQMQTLSMNRQV